MLKTHRKQAQKEFGVCGQCKDGWPDANLPPSKVVCQEGYGIRGVLQKGRGKYDGGRTEFQTD